MRTHKRHTRCAHGVQKTNRRRNDEADVKSDLGGCLQPVKCHPEVHFQMKVWSGGVFSGDDVLQLRDASVVRAI